MEAEASIMDKVRKMMERKGGGGGREKGDKKIIMGNMGGKEGVLM